MYKDIQAEFRDTSPFVVMFQQIEQSALQRRRAERELVSTGDQAITIG